MSAAEKVVRLPGVPPVRPYCPLYLDVCDGLLAAGLTAAELKMALAIYRQTIGYQKDFDDLTITRLAGIAGLTRQRGSAAFNVLLDRRIVSARKGKYGYIVGFNAVGLWLGLDLAAAAAEAHQNDAGVPDLPPHQNDAGASNGDGHPHQNDALNIKPKQITTPPYIPPCGSGLPADVDGSSTSEPDGLSPVVSKKANGGRRAKTTMQVWLDGCKAAGEKPLPADDPVFADAEALGIDMQWLRLAWVDFKARYTGPDAGRKRYADWRAVFRRAVRECWCKFWFMAADGSGMQLTSIGLARLALAKQAGELAGA